MLGTANKTTERTRRSVDLIHYPSFLVSGARSVANSLLYLTGLRRKPLLLEGGRHGDVYRNWSGDRRHRVDWAEPESEEELVELIRSARSVRVVGSGHSFNDALACDGLTVSLDRLCGIVAVDRVEPAGGVDDDPEDARFETVDGEAVERRVAVE